MTSLTYYSPAGNEIIFSKDSEAYRLLIGVKGLHENPELVHQTTQAPFQNGATRSLTLYNPREVSFPIRVWGPNLQALEQNGQELALTLNALNGPGTLVYTREDGQQFSLNCIPNGKCPGEPSNVTPSSYNTEVGFIAYDPFWYSYPVTRTDFGAGTPLRFPFKFPFKFPTTSPEAPITNYGNVSTPVTITITGEIVNPTITRTYADKYGNLVSEALSFTLTMAAGEILTITTGPENPTLSLLHDTGLYDDNPFQYLNANPKFWQLQPGINNVALTDVSIAEATIMTVTHASRFTAV